MTHYPVSGFGHGVLFWDSRNFYLNDQKYRVKFVKTSEKVLDKWLWRWYHISGCAGKLRTTMR